MKAADKFPCVAIPHGTRRRFGGNTMLQTTQDNFQQTSASMHARSSTRIWRAGEFGDCAKPVAMPEGVHGEVGH